MKCKICKKEFKAENPMWDRICSEKCRKEGKARARRKYRSSSKWKKRCQEWKKTRKGKECDARYRKGERGKANFKKAYEKYEEKNTWVTEANKRRRNLYIKCTRGSMKKWWSSKKINGCEECREFKNLCIFHIIPICNGGSDEKENLKCLCKKCCAEKSGSIRTIENDKKL